MPKAPCNTVPSSHQPASLCLLAPPLPQEMGPYGVHRHDGKPAGTPDMWATGIRHPKGSSAWGELTGAASAVLFQPVTSLTEALEGASQISTVMLTAAMTRGTLVNICRQDSAAGVVLPGSEARRPMPVPAVPHGQGQVLIPLSGQ